MSLHSRKLGEHLSTVATNVDDKRIDGPLMTQQQVDSTLMKRHASYGKFEDNATAAQEIKRAMRLAPKWRELEDDQREALELIASKIGRLLSGDINHYDSWHDISGYATLITKRLSGSPL